jgi:DNA-binding CsgD family transcriptional regulator
LGAGAQLLELLSTVVADQALVVVVDDAHWVDSLSAEAVAFALRRMVSERALVIVSWRDEEEGTVPPALRRLAAEGPEGPGRARIGLAGLSDDDVRQLGVAGGHPELTRVTAQLLQRQTNGNPLYVRALLEELSRETLAGTAAGSLPAPRSYSSFVGSNLAHCGADAGALAKAAAVVGDRLPLARSVQLSGLDWPRAGAALDRLSEAGLVTLTAANEVCFSHPLVRAAIYHDIAPGERSTLHLGAAGSSLDSSEQLRHRVAAALGEDPDLALEVATAAGGEAARGAFATAAHDFLTALRLGPRRPEADEWVLQAAECLASSGDTSAAVATLAMEVDKERPSARRELVKGRVAVTTGDRLGGRRHLEAAWASRSSTPAGKSIASQAANQLGMGALNEGRGEDALLWTARAFDMATSGTERADASAVRALARGELGQYDAGLDEIGPVRPGPAGPAPDQVGAFLGRGVLQLWKDELGPAIESLQLASGAVAGVPFYIRLIALFYLAEAEYRRGHWDESITHAELVTSLGRDANEVWLLGLAHAVAVLPFAGRGSWDLAEAHLRQAEVVADIFGDPANRWWVLAARARLCQARHQPEGVLSAAREIATLDLVRGLDEPGIKPWAQLGVEAATQLGLLDEARWFLDRVQAQTRKFNMPNHTVLTTRVAALLAAAAGDDLGAASSFEEGLAAEGAAEGSLEYGVLLLDYGSWLSRRQRVASAVTRLQKAEDLLGQLGARPWLERCSGELRRLGRGPKPAEDWRHRLSPQELTVTMLVSSGMTNREIANELVVSVKAIEYHLGNVYRKLGVTSRAKLMALVQTHQIPRYHLPARA